jgi:hypothetical protein
MLLLSHADYYKLLRESFIKQDDNSDWVLYWKPEKLWAKLITDCNPVSLTSDAPEIQLTAKNDALVVLEQKARCHLA